MREGNTIAYYSGVVGAAFALFFVSIGLSARADVAGQVVINEIMWDGTEYLELFNPTDSEIVLNGWSVTRQQTSGEEKIIVTFEAVAIAAGDYLLIERKEDAAEAASDVIASAMVLVNTGERLRLKDADGIVIDEVNQLGPWFAGDDTTVGISMERSDPAESGTDVDNWHTSSGAIGGRLGTPGQANSVVPVNVAPEAVVSVDGDEVMAGEAVSFSGEDSADPDGDELTYEWNFGEGGVASGAVVSHIFSAAGIFLVTLTVGDGDFTDVATATINVETPVYSEAVVLNEFLPNPVGSDTTAEFIELKNTGNIAVDLGGWQLDDAEGGSTAYTIPAGTLLPGSGYLSFLRAVTKIALNNDGETVRLLTPGGQVKSSFTYAESATEGVSYNRNTAGDFVLSTTLTAGLANIITAPAADDDEEEDEDNDGDYSDKVLINELLPNPAGSDTDSEFIELINTGSTSVSLAGWQLDDEEGGSSPHTLPAGTLIGAGEIVAMSRADTNIALNNDGDTARLLDPSGKVVSSFLYDESIEEDVAWARTSAGSYALTTTVTEGKTNVITAPNEEEAATGSTSGTVAGTNAKTVALKDVRQEKEGATITTEGVVSVPPEVLGKGVLYLAGSGIQVYFSKAEYPEFAVGDKVKVTGELASYLGEARLKLAAANDIQKMATAEAPAPHQLKTGEVGEDLEGTLVVIVGKVSRTSGNTFYVDDGSGEVKVFIKDTTDIEKPEMKQGAVVTITGVVSQTSSGYRILPRFQEDVRLGAVAGLSSFPAAGLSQLSQGWLTAVLVAIAGGLCFWQLRLVSRID